MEIDKTTECKLNEEIGNCLRRIRYSIVDLEQLTKEIDELNIHKGLRYNQAKELLKKLKEVK